jgi:hypothetical protein
MPAVKRPATVRPARQPKPDKPRLILPIGGKKTEVDLGSFSPLEAGMFRRATGDRLAQILSTGQVDLDHVAALAWIVERRTDTDLEWETYASAINLEQFAGSIISTTDDTKPDADPET